MATTAKNSQGFWSQRRKTARSKVIDITRDELVEESFLGEHTVPLVIKPRLKEMDLVSWVTKHRKELHEKILEHGGILFRGFRVKSVGDFENFNDAMGIELMKYMEGATPRDNVTAKVATSTAFPPEQTIFPHNELCYVNTWPRHILFCCMTAAEEGGATPIVDVRKVYKRLHPHVTERFRGRGWMLRRNFGLGFGRDWRDSFHVKSREELEAYCKQAGLSYEWRDGDALRTSQVRPVVADHPVTGDRLWFNHIAFWHLSSLEPNLREFMLKDFGEEGLPFASYYGDGTVIEDEVIEEMRVAYDAEKIAFPWQTGDILILDNMLIAHGREPFKGDRMILAVLGDATSKRFLREDDPDAEVC